MPRSKRKPEDDPKADLKKPKKARERKGTKKKGTSGGVRDERDRASRTFGEEVRRRIRLDEGLPVFEATPGIRRGGLDSLRSGDEIKGDKQFNASFRRLGPNMDEFFSTATTREFVKGLLGDTAWSDYSDEEQAYFGELVDILSAIRVPTKFVGYSLDTGKLQHPTSRPQAYFEDPYETASRHSELDVARRDYVQRAADAAIEADLGAREIVLAAARAAIEFTLNNFMAPISASNVQPFSKLAGVEITDEKVLEQVRWREFLKRFYVDVAGGTLRTGTSESRKASRTREWRPQVDTSYPSAPPSPFRDVDSSDFDEEDPPNDPSGVNPDLALEDEEMNIFGQDVSGGAIELQEFGNGTGDYGLVGTGWPSDDLGYGEDSGFGWGPSSSGLGEQLDESGFPLPPGSGWSSEEGFEQFGLSFL